MSDNLKSLLSAEAEAAEILDKARREAKAIRSSVPMALKELESRYEEALASAEKRETEKIEAETEEFRLEVMKKAEAARRVLADRSKNLSSRARELLLTQFLKDG